MLSFFPRGVLDEILNLIESVSEGFPSYSCTAKTKFSFLLWKNAAPDMRAAYETYTVIENLQR